MRAHRLMDPTTEMFRERWQWDGGPGTLVHFADLALETDYFFLLI